MTEGVPGAASAHAHRPARCHRSILRALASRRPSPSDAPTFLGARALRPFVGIAVGGRVVVYAAGS